MTEPVHVLDQGPDWMPAEMPPGYRTRLLEIERLSADLQAMDGIGRVLWATGEPLRDAVTRLFAELKCEVEAPQEAGGPIAVTLGPSQRLLVLVSETVGPIHKTHDEITRAFQAVQFADANDRVVFLAQGDPATPPADRSDPVLPDAQGLLEKMGVEVVSTTSVFRLWRLWLEDQQKARKALQRLHAEEGTLTAPWR
jgi:hypothetical protein